MDVIKFKLSRHEWCRVITTVNGTSVSKYAHEAERKKCDSTPYEEEYRKHYYHHFGDGIYPGWLYYELKGGRYYTCPGKPSAAFEPYIPNVSGAGLSMTTKWCKWCKKCRCEEEPKQAAVLGCCCGDDGCGQYLVRIMETENSVIWNDYYATKNNLHFEFEKKQYFKEVEKLIGLTIQTGKFDGLPMEIINDKKYFPKGVRDSGYSDTYRAFIKKKEKKDMLLDMKRLQSSIKKPNIGMVAKIMSNS
jgi:hypothetical protein